MKKIIISEGQYKRLFREQKLRYKADLMTPPVAMTDTISTAINYDLDLKKTADGKDFQVTWEELGYDPNKLPSEIKKKYPTYVPEIISGYGHKKNFNKELLTILKTIEEKSGLDLLITGGNDKYHQVKRKDSNHNTGNAIDFIINGSNGVDAQKKIEEVVLSMAMNEYPKLSFINEFQRSTGGSGGHFHISVLTELNHYHFYDEALRKEGEKYYGCCGKFKKDGVPVLEFKGNGSSIKEIMEAGRKKEPMKLKKVKVKSPEPIKTTEPEIIQTDLSNKYKKIVDSYKDKSKSERNKAIELYKEYYSMAKNEEQKEYFLNIILGIKSI